MDVNIFEDALLLDSAAYETEGASTKTANFRVYQFVRQPEGELTNVIFGKVIPDLLRLVPGLEIVGDGLETLVSRIRLFVSIPRGDSKITVHVPSCKGNNGIVLGKTHKTTGFLESNVNLGDCAFGDDNSVGGEIRALELPLVGHFGVEDVENTIYFSPPGGWGVVSDIDDTIKDSAVGDVLQTISKTFLEPFEPVTNMPELFSSLSTSLSTSDAPAQFFYLSSSPVQLYPHLHPFIQAKFPAGPLILRNYTFTDIPTLIDNLLLPTRDYKLGELRKIHSWYPDKKQLLVGDSTQEDPEAYGAAFREFGADWVGCIWIRAVDGSDNSDARFEAAFDGVPREKWRVFTDPVADELSNVDVVGGSC
ncbi:hypothetical protein VTO42DRAFT_6216 [Malbranchea cinnamomea]